MKARFLVTTVVALTALCLATPAHAGGWWSSLDLGRRYVSPGQRFTLDEDIMFATLEQAEFARSDEERYFAYLIVDLDTAMIDEAMSHDYREDWWQLSGTAHQAGEVSLDRWDMNTAWAHANIAIPELPGGRYWLMLCNLGCERPLADIVPTEVLLVEDALTARLGSKVENLARIVQYELRPLDRSNERVWSRANRAHTRITALEARLKRLSRSPDEQPQSLALFAWPPFVAGIGLSAVAIWGRKRLLR